MLNSYGYNRKTKEENEVILGAVKKHHQAVQERGFLVVMTVAVGSQNYDLDDADSDIDTFSFVLPHLADLAVAKAPAMGEFPVSDGICNYKDIRIALNLLRKASPNSVEYFTSKYKVYSPVFEPVLREYLGDNKRLRNMIHCDYGHMLYAMAGMAKQLLKRNMPSGKRYAHAIRLKNMYYNFMNSSDASAVLDLQLYGSRDLAMLAKRDTSPENEWKYNEGCDSIAKWLAKKRDELELTQEQEQTQQAGVVLIETLQLKLLKKYLEEINK